MFPFLSLFFTIIKYFIIKLEKRIFLFLKKSLLGKNCVPKKGVHKRKITLQYWIAETLENLELDCLGK